MNMVQTADMFCFYEAQITNRCLGLPPLAPANPFIKGLTENFYYSLRSVF